MERKNRNWLYLVPVAGAAFCLWYLYTSFYDVVYSDYIRLVNSYLPDVWNPAKFWVPDLLTRVPVNFLARIINTTFFHYSIRFDQVLGVVSLALSAVSVTYYVNRKQIGTIWFLAVMAVMFSLNKWEMLNNGSGWVHFLAFAGFYYHYQIWDRVWSREERKGDHLQMILLPWILILAVAGPYCAVYVAVLIAGYAFCTAVTWKREKRLEKRYLLYGLSVLLPFFCYLWSNAQVVPDWSGYGAAQGSLFQNLFRIPGYFIRFVLKSLASVVTGQELAKSLWSTNLPYLAVGIFVAAAYLLALYLQFSRKLYETTVFPLVLLVSGALNHALILLSSILSACVTAFAGPISFVGIAVPHIAKSLLKTAKPLLVIPACFLGGAVFCLFCDLIARTVFAPTELSISSVTAVFGAPVVIYIMIRRQQRI